MCTWKDNAKNWYACSWAGTNYPKYIRNRVKRSGWGVTIYRSTDFEGPIGGCIVYKEKVTLAGNYHIRSHQWDCIDDT